MNETIILSLIVFTPLVGAILISVMNREQVALVRIIGLASSSIAFLLSVWLFVSFDATSGDMQFVEKFSWIESLDVSYHLGADGISLLLIALTTLLTPIALLASWESIGQKPALSVPRRPPWISRPQGVSLSCPPTGPLRCGTKKTRETLPSWHSTRRPSPCRLRQRREAGSLAG